jgi:hypothetical protein
MDALLTSYGLASSASWVVCQATLSALLGTSPRVSSRIKAHHCCQVHWGPDCVALGASALAALRPLGLKQNYTVANSEPLQETPLVKALPAGMEPSDPAALMSRLATDDGGKALKRDDESTTVGLYRLRPGSDAGKGRGPMEAEAS